MQIHDLTNSVGERDIQLNHEKETVKSLLQRVQELQAEKLVFQQLRDQNQAIINQIHEQKLQMDTDEAQRAQETQQKYVFFFSSSHHTLAGTD